MTERDMIRTGPRGDNEPTLPVLSIDPSFTRASIYIEEIRYLGADVALAIPKGINPEVFRGIVVDYLGQSEGLDEAENIPMLKDGLLAGCRFGYIKTGDYLSRAARVFALAEQIKTGAFDESDDVSIEQREAGLKDYLEFNNTRIKEVVVIDSQNSIVAMCRTVFGEKDSKWGDFEFGHLYDVEGEDLSLAPLERSALSSLQELISLKGIGLGAVMEIPTIVTAEEYQDTDKGLALLLALDAFVFYSVYDVDKKSIRQHNLIIASTQPSLTQALIELFGFNALGPITEWGATPVWISADILAALYERGYMKSAVDPYINALKEIPSPLAK